MYLGDELGLIYCVCLTTSYGKVLDTKHCHVVVTGKYAARLTRTTLALFQQRIGGLANSISGTGTPKSIYTRHGLV